MDLKIRTKDIADMTIDEVNTLHDEASEVSLLIRILDELQRIRKN